MNSQQYEELCRYFLAEELQMDVDRIRSIDVPNPVRPGLPQYKHQIDLYWEIDTPLSVYMHIANAKWRAGDKVDQPEVLLLQQVKQKVAAHKAMMLTNQGFTAGAIAAAKDDGIALHIVKPNIDVARLPAQGREAIQEKLREIISSSGQCVFFHEIVHRAFDFSDVAPEKSTLSASVRASAHSTRIESTSQSRLGGAQTNRGTTGQGPMGSNRGATGPSTGRGGPVNRRS